MLSTKNKTIIDFYKTNSHLDFDTMNLLFIDIIKNIMKDMSNNINSNKNSLLIRELSKKISNLEVMSDGINNNITNKINNLETKSEFMKNDIISKFGKLESNIKENCEWQSENIKNIKNTISNIMKNISDVNSKCMENNLTQIREIVGHQNSNTEKELSKIISNNNKIFINKINEITDNKDICDFLKSEIQSVNSFLNEETNRLVSLFGEKNNDNEQIISTLNKKIIEKYNELNNTFKNNFDTFAKLQINTNNSMFGEIKKNNEVVNNMNTYFQKQFCSSSKGKQGEQVLENVLNNSFPTADIINTSAQKHSGDFILQHKDKEKILIDTKDYNRNVPTDEVKKIIRDIEIQDCHGILISQNSGICLKNNFEINIHNNKVIIYITNCEYDGDKIKLAVNTIEYLSRMINELRNINEEIFEENEESTNVNGEIISSELLIEINKEYQNLVRLKDIIIKETKKYQKTLNSHINDIQLNVLSDYLSKKFADIKVGSICEYCNRSFKNINGLNIHQRTCVEKNKQCIEIKTQQNKIVKMTA